MAKDRGVTLSAEAFRRMQAAIRRVEGQPVNGRSQRRRGPVMHGGLSLSFFLHHTATNTTAMANDTDIALTWADPVVGWDTGGFWDSANPSRLTIPSTGYYLFGGWMAWAFNLVGDRTLWVRRNGTAQLGMQRIPAPLGAVTANVSLTHHYLLEAGQYIEMVVKQTSGGTLNGGGQHFWLISLGG